VHYFWLFIAILSEVIGTTALKASAGFTRLVPTLIVVAGYSSAIFFLTLTVKEIQTGVAYALWSGLGILFIVLFAWIFHGEKVDAWGWVGIALIILGVLVLNLFSKTVTNAEGVSNPKETALEK
jgi:multidrug transporter EmrE-like cation transporter